MTTENTVYWDPYRTEFWANPHPVFKRLRNEAPLYRNEEYDFYAVSRFSDVERGLTDREHLSSSRGDILEYIKADLPRTKGLFIWEDPPEHTAHRGVLSKVFTPRRMNELEGKIRAYCTRCLDPLVGAGGFDFVKDLGAEMPMRVIGMLLGIPEEDQVGIREMVDASLRTEAGKPLDSSQARNSGQEFAQYIEWRSKHPSSDLMTDLLQAEFQDETGTQRRLTREEILVFVNLLAGAGNETTTRLIGWTGKVLADHPEQRAEIAKDPTLIPNAIEELLRFEPPGPSVARYVAKDFEIQGQTVPAGAALLLLVAAANRDESRYPDGDRFDIHRKGPPHITFGRGIHACLGAALARIEGRVALHEVLKRFPNWTVDLDNAKIGSTSTVRGWETLPVFTGNGARTSARRAPEPAAAPTVTASPTGSWELNLSTPVGAQVMTAHIVVNGQSFSGTMSSGELTSQEISGAVSGNTLSWTLPLTKPMPIKLGFEATVAGDTLTGEVKFGMFGKGALTGKRL